MLRIFKMICAAAVSAAVLTGGATVYYRSALPDSYYVTAGEALTLSTALPIAAAGAQSASAQALTSPTTDAVELRLFGVIPVKTVQVTTADAPLLVPGGTPFGLRMMMDGVMVVGVGEVCGSCPATAAGIAVGDVLISVNDTEICGNTALRTAIAGTDGAPCKVTLRRDGVTRTVWLQPVYSAADGCYQAGLWVRDSTAGVGTVTYFEAGTGSFAGLGHPICDADTGEMIPLAHGEVAAVTIGSVIKGTAGAAGELRGYFLSNAANGSLLRNNACGVYGEMLRAPDDDTAVPLGRKQDIHTGAAEVLCTVSGTTPQRYAAEIVEIDLDSTGTRDMVVEMTDPALLEVTGGIVQGMSGSPILQNGRLVGAVTHVLVNDPTRGYAIFAERMYAAGK